VNNLITDIPKEKQCQRIGDFFSQFAESSKEKQLLYERIDQSKEEIDALKQIQKQNEKTYALNQDILEIAKGLEKERDTLKAENEQLKKIILQQDINNLSKIKDRDINPEWHKHVCG